MENIKKMDNPRYFMKECGDFPTFYHIYDNQRLAHFGVSEGDIGIVHKYLNLETAIKVLKEKNSKESVDAHFYKLGNN